MTPDLRRDFDRRLSQAQCDWDTSFAAILSAAPERYAALIRGGPPDAQQWARARAAAESASRRAVSDQALRDILRAALVAAPATVVEINPEGITVTNVTLDKCGSPRLHRASEAGGWHELIPELATTGDDLHFQLAGRVQNLDKQALDHSLRRAAPAVRGERAVVVCRPGSWPLLSRIAELTAASSTGETSLVWAGPGASLLNEVAATMPLQRTYSATLARLDARTGRLAIELTPLFKPGDRPGATAALSLRKFSSDDGAVTLAVVARGGERDELLTAVAVPPPSTRRYQVKAVLDGPGKVRFTEPPGIVSDARPWPETLASVPSEVTVPTGPVDLVCAIELGGPATEVKKRKNLVAGLLSLLESDYPAPELVRVSVIGCVDHVFSPGREHTIVLHGAPLAPIADARRALRNLRGVEISNVDAAPLEELLAEAAAQLAGSAGQGRAARVLLIGARPPHPYPQLWANACPEHIRWDSRLTELISTRRARCVAVCARIPPSGQLAGVWRRLGQHALRELDDTSEWQIGEDLGMLTRSSERLAIPLAD